MKKINFTTLCNMINVTSKDVNNYLKANDETKTIIIAEMIKNINIDDIHSIRKVFDNTKYAIDNPQYPKYNILNTFASYKLNTINNKVREMWLNNEMTDKEYCEWCKK